MNAHVEDQQLFPRLSCGECSRCDLVSIKQKHSCEALTWNWALCGERQCTERLLCWGPLWQRCWGSGAHRYSSSFSWIWQMTSWFSRIQHHQWQHSQFWSRQSGYGVQELPGSLSTHFNEKPGGKIIMVCIQNDYKQNQSHWVLKGKVLEQMKELNKGPRLTTTMLKKKKKLFLLLSNSQVEM